MSRSILAALACAAALASGGPSLAGPVNPDVSVIGQPIFRVTDDPSNSNRKHPVLDVGETEIVFESYLNPYSKGTFVASLDANAISLEEGYFTIYRGLPLGLNVKGGKYRVGFGKLNPLHPHAYPFSDRFRVLAAYLPGSESLNETGLSVSKMVPLVGDASMTASADYLQGDTFRIARKPSGDPNDPLATSAGDGASLARPAVLGRVSTFWMVGEMSGLEVGASAVSGTNNVAARARTTVYGVDAKAKLWSSPRSYLVLQGEGLKLERDDAAWSPAQGYTTSRVGPTGGYAFADYNWGLRYDAGVSYERFQEPTAAKPWDQAAGAFAGYAVLEESLVFHVGWERFMPRDGGAVNTATIRVIYSMGPHKAHQF